MTENNHTVSAVFTFKNAECKSKFIDFCNGEKGLGVTRSWPGCKSIECYEVSDNPNKIIIWQKWENKESHESYVKHRHDEGSFDMLGEWVEGPPEISALVPVNFDSDEDTIRNIVNAIIPIPTYIILPFDPSDIFCTLFTIATGLITIP